MLPKSEPDANHELPGLVYLKSSSAVVASCVQRPSGARAFPLGHRLSIPSDALGSLRRTLVNIALPMKLSERSERNRLTKKFVGGATLPELFVPSAYAIVALSGAVTESRMATFNLLPMRPASFAAPQIWVPALPGESKTVVPARAGSGVAAPILREYTS